MKNLSKPLQITLAVLLPLLIVGAIVGIYLVGDYSVQSADSPKPANNCNESQEDKDRVLKLYEDAVSPIDIYPPRVIDPAESVDHEAIMALEGECEVYALEKAYELGGRILRDLSDCWDECILTMEYLEGRINYAQKDGIIVHISTG